MTKRICLDPGHGGDQPGAVYGGIEEKAVNLYVCTFAQGRLLELDPEIWVCLTRDFDRRMSLEDRCKFANNMNVDAFVSVHCNADPDDDSPGNPEAKGEEIWIYKGSSGGLRLAQALSTAVDGIFPNEPFRGIKEAENLYVLKYTNAPAALVELGFIDKSSSVEKFSDIETLKKMGLFVAQGIVKYFELAI